MTHEEAHQAAMRVADSFYLEAEPDTGAFEATLKVYHAAYLEACGAVLVPRAALAEIAKAIPEITWVEGEPN